MEPCIEEGDQAMNAGIMLVLCAVSALLFLAWIAWRVHSQRNVGHLRDIDLQAFENLACADEEDFLKTRLRGSEFRRIQRERLRATMEYVSGIAHNAEVLLQMASSALRDSDPEVANAAKLVVDNASKLRLNAQVARLKLLTAMLWPGIRIEPTGVLEPYRKLKSIAAVLEQANSHLGTVNVA
jgi:hypothetical protein